METQERATGENTKRAPLEYPILTKNLDVFLLQDMALRTLAEPEKFGRFIQIAAANPNLTASNQLLLYMQTPVNARDFRANSYGEWKMRGREVMKGERSLVILAPVLNKDGRVTFKNEQFFVKEATRLTDQSLDEPETGCRAEHGRIARAYGAPETDDPSKFAAGVLKDELLKAARISPHLTPAQHNAATRIAQAIAATAFGFRASEKPDLADVFSSGPKAALAVLTHGSGVARLAVCRIRERARNYEHNKERIETIARPEEEKQTREAKPDKNREALTER